MAVGIRITDYSIIFSSPFQFLNVGLEVRSKKSGVRIQDSEVRNGKWKMGSGEREDYFFCFTPSPVMGTKMTEMMPVVSILPDLLTTFFNS